MSLQGKFVLLDHGDSFQTGEVVEIVSPEVFLIRTDPVEDGVPAVMLLVGLELMMSGGFLFDSRDDLMGWLRWVETPSSSKVIRLVGKET